jgi:MoxR-like ATPase
MAHGMANVSPVMLTSRLLDLQRETDKVFVDPVLMEYVVRLATATRNPSEYGLPEIKKYITYGASPRASINLILTGRALAFMRGRTYVLAQDVLDLVHDVLRHRLVLSYEALSDNVSPEQLIDRVLQKIPAPTQALQERVSAKA